ncbi:hypothetical protein T779_02805, partial [Staphylococcus aureus LAMC0010]
TMRLLVLLTAEMLNAILSITYKGGYKWT